MNIHLCFLACCFILLHARAWKQKRATVKVSLLPIIGKKYNYISVSMQHSSNRNRKKVETSSFLLTQLTKKRSPTIIATPQRPISHVSTVNQRELHGRIRVAQEGLFSTSVTSHRKHIYGERVWFGLLRVVASWCLGFVLMQGWVIDVYIYIHLYPHIIIPSICVYIFIYIYVHCVYTLYIHSSKFLFSTMVESSFILIHLHHRVSFQAALPSSSGVQKDPLVPYFQDHLDLRQLHE